MNHKVLRALCDEYDFEDASLEAVVGRLPWMLQCTLILYLSGYTHKEIGKMMGVTRTCITERLKRIRAFIRENYPIKALTVLSNCDILTSNK